MISNFDSRGSPRSQACQTTLMRCAAGPALAAAADFDPCQEKSFDSPIATWLPLTYAVNRPNRSMGRPDRYPFVIAPAVVAKLRFIHDLTNAL